MVIQFIREHRGRYCVFQGLNTGDGSLCSDKTQE